MAVKSTGSLSFSELATEFNDTQPYSMSEYVRGGDRVPDAPANSNIPTLAQKNAGGESGRMKFSHFYNSQSILAQIIAANAENLNLETLFGTSDWQSATPKQVTINSGVIVGATSTSNAALTIPSGMGGTLEIINNGAIQGAGGAAGQAGGPAVAASSAATFTNNGDVYAGGGGGGSGGTGGQGGNGSYSQVVSAGPGRNGTDGLGELLPVPFNPAATFPCTNGISYQPCADLTCSTWYGSGRFCRDNYSYVTSGGSSTRKRACSKCQVNQTVSTTGTAGGAGGAGGVGQGYSQATAGTGTAGAAGANPPTNAGRGGTGGTGGSGGSWGTAGSTGSTGNTGASGTVSSGSGGSAGTGGGAAGNYVTGISNLTFTNNGNVAGGTN